MRELAAQTQVIRVVAMVAAKVGAEARLERERDAALQRLIDGLPEKHKARFSEKSEK